MLIKCSFLVPQESVSDYLGFINVRPLPEYILKEGPYISSKKGAFRKIISLYKFDKSKFEEARKCIFEQLDSLRGLPEFTLSAHIYGPRPSHMTFQGRRAAVKICEGMAQ